VIQKNNLTAGGKVLLEASAMDKKGNKNRWHDSNEVKGII
jgi:hypothetical protein